MKDHVSLLNYLIKRYGYKRYLEIGCATDSCFNKIEVEAKVGVDPASGGTVRLPSDEYFRLLDKDVKFDLVFIDGLHFSEQVDRDIRNSLKHLYPGGTIVLHDCKPTSAKVASWPREVNGSWTGDVWKAIAKWRKNPEVDTCVIDFDWGCGVIRVRDNTGPLELVLPKDLSWEFFVKNTKELLNLKDAREFVAWLNLEAEPGIINRQLAKSELLAIAETKARNSAVVSAYNYGKASVKKTVKKK